MQLNSHIVIWWQGTAWHPYKQTSDKGYGKAGRRTGQCALAQRLSGISLTRRMRRMVEFTGFPKQHGNQRLYSFLSWLRRSCPASGLPRLRIRPAHPLGLVAGDMSVTDHCLVASIACIICAFTAIESPVFSNPEEKKQGGHIC